MNSVETKQPTRASSYGNNHSFLNYDLSRITFYYSDCVVWLFDKIQNLMVGQKLETVSPLLYYSKSLLDFHLQKMTKFALPFLKVINDCLKFVFEIFVHKIRNLEIGAIFSKFVVCPSSVELSAHFPSFSSTLNPFEILNNIQEITKIQRLVLYHLISLALTYKQFKKFSPKIMLYGCFNPLQKRRNDWKFKLPFMAPSTILQHRACEGLYEELLQHWEFDASN